MSRYLILLACGLCLAAPLAAQVYTPRQIILDNLERPSGILLAPNGDLYFTEVPTPGVGGAAGGTNRVNVKDAGSTTVNVIEVGMPEPLHLAMAAGEVFWVCRTAGVIFQRGAAPIVRNLDQPTGLAGGPGGTLYFTQVPTPGMNAANGGRNTVSRLVNGVVSNISMAEPQPNDIAVAPNGDMFWTCTTAGVIVRQTAAGVRSVVARGLDAPHGLAVDDQGVLYFTEVPTPGVSGANGGSNEVWRFDPNRSTFTLISRGQPEPYDITVRADGSSVYWTCRTAGVILRADLVQNPPRLDRFGSTAPGATVRFFLDAPAYSGAPYQVANSEGLGTIQAGTTSIGLAPDALLIASLSFANSPLFSNYANTLDANGMGTAHLALPSDPMLSGTNIFTAFVVLDFTQPNGIGAVSETLFFQID